MGRSFNICHICHSVSVFQELNGASHIRCFECGYSSIQDYDSFFHRLRFFKQGREVDLSYHFHFEGPESDVARETGYKIANAQVKYAHRIYRPTMTRWILSFIKIKTVSLFLFLKWY